MVLILIYYPYTDFKLLSKKKGNRVMWAADNWKEYELLDASDGERLERWGKYILVRPDPQVIWKGMKKHNSWRKADAT